MNFLLQLINAGKPISIILLVILAIATFLFFYRFFYLHSITLDSESFLIGIRNNLKSNKLVEALAICKDTQTPIASVCESILSRWSKDEMALHCAAEEAALIEIPRIQRYRRLIAAIGQLAPMLGFLGSIIAFMELFAAMKSSSLTISVAQMEPHIHKALILTALGIGVGMIVHFFNVILEERCHALVNDMEKTAVELINFLIEPKDLADRMNAQVLSEAQAHQDDAADDKE
ncbi:MAG: MotA/TolQ/ExbB proton channel family protein [Victivallales bacterium]|nr:MotA/TolQ/ExbB proton channel family protein [Victivallales bacterium]